MASGFYVMEDVMREVRNCYLISDNVSERISILKFWLSIMVVYIHSYGTGSNFATGNIVFDVPVWLDILKYIISQSISRCAVPAFFLLSAVLLYRKNFTWKDNMKKKLSTLFFPYVVMNTLWIVLFWVGQQMPMFSRYFSNPENIVASWGLYEWGKAYGLVSLNKLPMLYPLWFVRNLLVLNVFALVIKKIIDIFPRVSLIILLILWFYPISCIGSYVTQSICFWGFGYLLVYYNVDLNILDKNKIGLFLAYCLIIVLDVMLRKVGDLNVVAHSLVCIVGIMFWFTCLTQFDSMKFRNIVLYFASFNFCIFIFHEMSLTMLKKIIVKLLPITSGFQFLEYIGIPIIVIIECILLSIAMKKYTPKLYGSITGYRNR